MIGQEINEALVCYKVGLSMNSGLFKVRPTFEKALELSKFCSVVKFPEVLCFLCQVLTLYESIPLV